MNDQHRKMLTEAWELLDEVDTELISATDDAYEIGSAVAEALEALRGIGIGNDG